MENIAQASVINKKQTGQRRALTAVTATHPPLLRMQQTLESLNEKLDLFLRFKAESSTNALPNMLTPAEAAKVLNVCRNTLEAMVNDGVLREGYHYHQRGSLKRFHPDLIDRLLNVEPQKEGEQSLPPVSPVSPKPKDPQKRPRRKPKKKSTINADY